MVLVWLGVHSHNASERENLARAVERIIADDPALETKTAADGGLMLGGSSEEQLNAAVDRLRNEFGVSAAVTGLQVACKEALTRIGQGSMFYAPPPDAPHEYARVNVRVHPGGPGSGFVFEDETYGTGVPHRFMAPVEQAIRAALERGSLTGCPIEDVRVVLVYGALDEDRPSETAVVTAATMAFQRAARNAGPVRLEPIMNVAVVVSAEYERMVTDLLSGRRGDVHFWEMWGVAGPGVMTIQAQVPLAEMFGFGVELRDRTRGRATFAMEFSHYAPSIFSGEDGEPDAEVTSPLRPRTPLRSLSASVPEPPPELRFS